MAEVLLQYVQQGARIIRLDAIAYLWKQIGTSCIHLPQTHAVVKLLRELLALAAPGRLLLTETNVPHAENISYFGDGDEAHMVYQFSLPPLLLDAWLNEDARPLVRWLAELAPAPPGTTFLNFTASHDGIGVRPLEGLVPAERFRRLADTIRARGGLVSTRHGPDGRDLPYELNVTYFDAVTEPGSRDYGPAGAAISGEPGPDAGLARDSRRVLFQPLRGRQRRGRRAAVRASPPHQSPQVFARRVESALERPESREARVLAGYRRLLAVRRRATGLSPGRRRSRCGRTCPPWLVAVLRTSLDGRQRILALVNVSGQEQGWELPADIAFRPARELIGGRPWPQATRVELDPYETVWLESTS